MEEDDVISESNKFKIEDAIAWLMQSTVLTREEAEEILKLSSFEEEGC